MRAKKLAGFVAAPFLAAVLAAGAGASMTDHASSVVASQHGANKNGTEQDADTWSKTQQSNDNSSHSEGHGYGHDNDHGYGKDHDKDHGKNHDKDYGNNHGKSSDVTQDNDADTKSKSDNDNYTKQKLDQTQRISVENNFVPKHECRDDDDSHHGDNDDSHHGYKRDGDNGHGKECDHFGGKRHNGNSGDIDATQKGHNDNWTDQKAKSSAKTEQENTNAGSGKSGDVDQSNVADTKAKSSNDNWTEQSLKQRQALGGSGSMGHDNGHDGYGKSSDCGCSHHGNGSSGDIDATQKGHNDNWTDQKAKSSAKTEQANVNAPIGSSNSGDVDQSNDADTKAKSSNDNGTEQKLNQDQTVGGSSGKGHNGGSGDIDATQKGSNDNWTDQQAESKAGTFQVNIYAPITVFSKNYRGGDVTQSNDANTTSTASNDNYTKQKLNQDQDINSSGNGDVTATQSGKNSNGTNQSSSSVSETYQVNIYAPISVFSDGYSGGDVDQSNGAQTTAGSTNSNGTGQFAGQGQAAGSGGH